MMAENKKTEKDLVCSMVKTIQKALAEDQRTKDSGLVVKDGRRLPYAYQVRSYGDQELKQDKPERRDYATDLLVSEKVTDQEWTPRVVIEAKISEVTTHDVITYSQKAAEHKFVHPYLRYGILVGNRQDRSLPGLLFRHGSHFDFMVSWKCFGPSNPESEELIDLVCAEVEISRTLEKLFFDSKKKDFGPYRFLRRSLILKPEG